MLSIPKFARLTPPERRLRVRALIAVLWFRLALCFFPLPRIRTWLEKWSPNAPAPNAPAPNAPAPNAPAPKSSFSPARIGENVVAASRLVPHSTCLVQALAAQWLLRREGFAPELHVGVSRSEGGALAAHAWVECEGGAVVGGGDLGRYTPILRWQNK